MRMRRALITIVLLVACGGGSVTFAEEEIKVPYDFRSWGSRDPFQALQPMMVVPDLVIHDLVLTGIIDIGGGRVAIFRRRKGPGQTYKLRGERLYGKDGRMIPAIRGRVLDEGTVLLVQGDEEIPFTLSASAL